MDTLHSQIESMRRRLAENAHAEQTLLRALGEALDQVDQQLLREVRQVTSDHEVRRALILGELQVLASHLCAFPADHGALPAIDGAGPVTGAPAPGRPAMRHAPGDWRLAAQNVAEDDLDLPFAAAANA
jgi:hypothetical protein